MTTPRIEVDLSKIRQNARYLVSRLSALGISVLGVTKGVCGHPGIARAMLDGGVAALGDARVSNVEKMRAAGITAPIVLIRTPMHSQVDRIVRTCGTSLNADFGIVEALARAACRAGRVHRVVLMTEMGDGREGMPLTAMSGFARRILNLRGVALAGIGANFACFRGRVPDRVAMRALSDLVSTVERDCGLSLNVVSGGNSANLTGLLEGGWLTRVNELRLGEAILLGRDPLTRHPIEGLFTDAFVLVGEVIESAADTLPPGLGRPPAILQQAAADSRVTKLLVALGEQDTDPGGLTMPDRLTLLGSTSDHLVLRTSDSTLIVGTEIRFQPDYSALMRAMSAPDVVKTIRDLPRPDRPPRDQHHHCDLEPA